MSNKKQFNICVIGGGPAGMAAAWAAARCGCKVTLIERNPYLGGVLPQCIHTGFGTQLYGEDLTGGEYEERWERMLTEAGVRIILNATVLRIQWMWQVYYADAENGETKLSCDACIIATGATERTLPQMDIPGSRPAGVYTAGAAQRMMNIYNQMPGRSAVILGSGDIGLIMARRMKLEGIDVKMVLGERASGLARNIVQCVKDFDIPLRYGWTVECTHGYKRLSGVTIREIISGKTDFISCDTLLVAAGLVPDNTLYRFGAGNEGLYICGNAAKIHDLVDHVSQDGVRTALTACRDWTMRVSDYRAKTISWPEDVLRLAEMNMPLQQKGKTGNMICTICPKSCNMNVTQNPFSVSGAGCERGEAFARQEIESPMRTVTTIVKTDTNPAAYRGHVDTISVRTEKPVRKDETERVMDAARKIKASSDTTFGDVLTQDGYRFKVTGKRI